MKTKPVVVPAVEAPQAVMACEQVGIDPQGKFGILYPGCGCSCFSYFDSREQAESAIHGLGIGMATCH